jgi:radical SAM protein with 4Fe4S-binding SPASM domain
MSHVRQKRFWEKLQSVRSRKSLAQNYLLSTMAGQKLFLFNGDLPRIINISTNEKTCFFKCTMCPFAEEETRDLYKSQSEMSFQTLEKIVASIPNDSYRSFDISAIGETLQFSQLPDFIAYMKQKKPLVNTIVSTNGVLLTESLLLRLAEAGLDNLQVSLFAYSPEDHYLITKTHTYEKVCENLRQAGLLKKKLGLKKPYLQTFILEARETLDKVKPFLDYWSQYVDFSFSRPLYNVSRQIEGLTPAFEPTPPSRRYPCIMPWYSAAVRSNGDVLNCYTFHWHKESVNQILGNINDQSLRDIWANPEFQYFRESHMRLALDEFPVCLSCDGWSAYTDIWNKSNGSYAAPSISIADFIKPSPSHRGG